MTELEQLLIERACRRQQRSLRSHGARLLGTVSAAAREIELPADQAELLLQRAPLRTLPWAVLPWRSQDGAGMGVP
mgnify:CR=1 FL=1